MIAEGARHMRRVHLGWWLFYVALLATDVALFAFDLPINIQGFLSYVLSYLIPMGLALGISLWLAYRLEGVERTFWGLLAAASASFLVAEIYWTSYETWVDFRGPRIPNWFELGHLLGFTFFFMMLISMTDLGEARFDAGIRTYLDILAAAIVGFALSYWLWTLPLFVSLPMGGWRVAIVAGMFPVAGALLLVAMMVIVAGWKAYRWRIWERLVAGAVALFGVGVMSFPLMYSGWITSPAPHRFAADAIVFGFGFYLLFMAGIYRATTDDEGARAVRWSMPQLRPEWLPMLYPTALAAVLVFMGVVALRIAGRPGGQVIVVATLLLALVLIIRSWLGSLELAHHRARSITDTASGAYNPRYLYERLPRELDDARAGHVEVAAIAVDIVDFRDLVKMWGVEAGDRLLARLVDVVRGELPADTTVYRVGRDEFVAVVARVSASEAASLARRVSARICAEVTVNGDPVAISAGVAVFPDHANDAGALVSRAVASQQLARSAERPDVVVYDADVVEAADPLVRLDRARRQSHRARLRALAAAVDARDASTRLHSQTVAELVSAFALLLDLSESRTRTLELAAQLHDIGKIGIADEILLKSSPLSDEEWECVHGHCELGERLLAPAEIPEVLPIVRHHHERWDGTGYPDALSGSDIPLEARMLAICDAFEAMTTGRRWQPALSVAATLEELERNAGTSFDPGLTETFSRMVVRMHGRPIAGRMAESRRDMGLAEQ
jgi:diguanylate cyclase (GGDEF)-like protein